MSKKIDIPPAFVNVIVIAVRSYDGTGNAGDGLYNITTLPETVAVNRPNTIVNFQLIPPTPDEFVFTGIDRKPSVGVRQLSNASVSLDGKMLTFSDENSDKESVGVTLLFSSGQGSIMHDPQIQNTPET